MSIFHSISPIVHPKPSPRWSPRAGAEGRGGGGAGLPATKLDGSPATDSPVPSTPRFAVKDLFYLDCDNCTAHAGAVDAYIEARTATNNWATVAAAVNATGHQWSITGHGFGGMVAQVAALDLGWAGKSHWIHSHGSPRVMNAASANLYNSLYQGEASQRTVANNDSVPTIIPESDDYTFTLEGFHVYGTNATYGQK